MITNGRVVLPGESAGLSPGGLDAAARTGAAAPAGNSVTVWTPPSAASANAGSLCRSPWAHRHSHAHNGSGSRSCRGPKETGKKVRG